MFATKAEEWDPAFDDLDHQYLEMLTRTAPEPDSGAALPRDLDQMLPGIMLAAVLESIDVTALSGYDRIVFLRAQQRMASHYGAQMYAAMAAVADFMQDEEDYQDDHASAVEAAAAEIRAALRLTRRATDAELSLALDLHTRLPAVWDALRSGAIDVRRARLMVDHTVHLSIAAARTAIGAVIGEAPGLTTGQLAARLRRLCVEADPDDARDRFETAVHQRRVVVEPTVDGTAHLEVFDAAPDLVSRAMDRIDGLARSLRRSGETRTMDQLRADVLLDLLTGDDRANDGISGRRGVVDIVVDLETLAQLSEAPGELGGYGPVIADIARQVADQSPDARWRWTMVDSDSRMPIGGGVTRRRPTGAQRRRVQARDRMCVFPGCRMPATRCDVDHIVAFGEGGPTNPRNNAPACRHDHVWKHRHRWRYRRLHNGDYVWTSRLGHRYTTSGKPP